MCGIVGAVAERDVVPILLEGLRRLEYRGYDSAGLAVLDKDARLQRARAVGRVDALAELLEKEALRGRIGIAHTRWATHGAPRENNAHPHISDGRIALVHNGIIENHAELKASLEQAGYRFESDTDTEVVAHRLHQAAAEHGDLLTAMSDVVSKLRGAYALVSCDQNDPQRLIVARHGCPVVIGLGIGENFVASDIAALLPVTRRFIFLEEGDVAEVRRDGVRVFDRQGAEVERPVKESQLSADAVERGDYRHYMLKEIHEQPAAVSETLEERISQDTVLPGVFGHDSEAVLSDVDGVHIVACGTSYHAALIARYQIEQIARLPCSVEIASEYRYREPVVRGRTLFVCISQSGETADTLAALREAGTLPYRARLAICNVPESSMVRESELVLMTRAGPEIGVASTKAFTTQLVALSLLALSLARAQKQLDAEQEKELVQSLIALPGAIEAALEMETEIAELAEDLVHRHHALFLGRGVHYPVAMEGALKLKEISYIHAEAYAAGELKHGPLALVDEDMPVVAVAPNDQLLDKIRSNLEEVRARGGQLIVFAAPGSGFSDAPGMRILSLPRGNGPLTDPALFTIPLQLLAYHVAVHKGTDVDKPRNLAKSVTVE